MYSTLPLSPRNHPVLFQRGGSHSASDAVPFALRVAPCRASVQTFTAEAATATTRTGKGQSGSLYEVLRVKKTACFREIKGAYRSLAKLYHPDTSESDGKDFIEIHNAYATLSDPTTRMRYDLSLGAARRPGRRSSRAYPTRTWETDQCW